MLAEDPLLDAEANRLRRELNSYADARDILPPADGRPPRTVEDFHDLDHEMITAMMEHNHTLNIWRYVLIACCLLLIGLSGYLFRLKENVRGELVTERAVHAQDELSYRQDLQRSRAAIETAAGNWDELRSYEEQLDSGALHVHVLAGAGVALVDLSDLPLLAAGQAYYVFGGEGEPEEVRARQQGGLSVIRLNVDAPVLRVYRRTLGEQRVPEEHERPLIVMVLPHTD